MFSIPEQFSAATKVNLEAPLALVTALTNTTLKGVEKFAALNINVAKAALEEFTVAVKQLISAKDAQEVFALSAAHVQPTVEKAIAYGRQVTSIASSTQTEFTKATETQIAEANRQVLALIEEVTKNAPAGSGDAVALVKAAINGTNAWYEQLAKITKHAVETLEANLDTVVSKFSETPARPASSRTK